MKTVSLQKNAFVPPRGLSRVELGRRVPVKCYEGDPVSDTPEFKEVCQVVMPLSSVVNDESGRLQFKKNVNVLDEKSNVFPGVNKILRSLIASRRDIPTLTNVRISGRGWQFPSHFDAVDQYILHIYGEKTWGFEDACCKCCPGDILFIPAGVWHAAYNESGASAIANVGYDCSCTPQLSQKFAEFYPAREKAILHKMDDLEI